MIPTKYVLLLPNGHVSYHVAMMELKPSIKELGIILPLLQCENMEHVSCLYNPAFGWFPTIRSFRKVDMFVDEMGHVHSGEPLPFNENATKLYYAAQIKQGGPPPNFRIDPTIVGGAIVFEREVWY